MSQFNQQRIIDHSAAIIRMFDIEPRPVDRILDAYLRKHRGLGSGERRAVADAVFGVMRWRLRLDGLLKLSGVKRPGNAELVSEYLRTEGKVDDQLTVKGFPGGAAAFHSFPSFLYDMFCKQYGKNGAGELADSLNEPQSPTLRVNTNRMDRDGALKALKDAGVEARATEYSPFGIRLSRRISPSSINLFSDGVLDFQDESSQLAVMLASPKPGENILDACAGAGGKSLGMSVMMAGEGQILASDVDDRKLAKLDERSKCQDSKIIKTAMADDVDASMLHSFDLVFIDAPCTGTGTLRRSPDIKWRIDRQDIDLRSKKQREILAHYSRFVRPGGRLVYATCSVIREENENVVQTLISKGGFEMVDARRVLSDADVYLPLNDVFMRMDPRQGEWDGFFAALLRRVE